ncbi:MULTISPECIES: hypothetical protein [unclassified Salinibacterium]|uniref:hypothetical protein n=1 Tax=unclassified Salinibacterium TaxID=2632331 RepID=UPI0018CDD554|nr:MULTISPECIES: hypothetical protein [unclassified Salinibacterium]MBH0053123.1 hypothetical protein [Salinibacterium sp. SWN139]MBH0082389.1 hypothetical protein [Salinibacterium sp. SWN167]
MESTWKNTRLAVFVGTTMITPVDTFTPSFSLNTETIHSLEATHVGYVANPESFTFSVSVKAIGGGAAHLMNLAMTGTEFSVGLYRQADSSPDEWDFEQILLEKCIITSANPSNATTNGAPNATFSGVARKAGATLVGESDAVSLPVFEP